MGVSGSCSNSLQMVIVTSPEKPFPYNIKGYPRRKWILKDYQEEISALYAAVEETAQSDVAAPAAWDEDSTRTFLRTVVERVLKKSIPDDADFFRNGCDRYITFVIHSTITDSRTNPYCLLLAFKLLGSETPSFAQCASPLQPQPSSSRLASSTRHLLSRHSPKRSCVSSIARALLTLPTPLTILSALLRSTRLTSPRAL